MPNLERDFGGAIERAWAPAARSLPSAFGAIPLRFDECCSTGISFWPVAAASELTRNERQTEWGA